MTHNVGAMITWSLFASEALNAVYDLRWAIVFCIVLIATDFWWGWRESKKHYKEAKTEEERDELMTKLNKAKKALCEVCDMMEEAEGGENTMNERGMYRDDMYYRRGGRYRDGRYGY